MGIFCGEPTLASSDVSVTECTADVFTFCVHLLFVLVAAIFAVVQWLRSRSPCDITNNAEQRLWVHFPGHNVRWMITLALLILNTFEACEGVLMEVSDTGVRLHLYLPRLAVLAAAMASLGFYHLAETYNFPQMLFVSLIYWVFTVVAKSLQLAAYVQAGFQAQQACVCHAIMAVLLYVTLVLLELHALVKLRYMCEVGSRAVPEKELSHLNYVHPYTTLLSRATWHWLTPLLIRGYRKPMEMDDLGTIPQEMRDLAPDSPSDITSSLAALLGEPVKSLGARIQSEHSKANFDKFKRIFEEEKTASFEAPNGGRSPSLWRCYARAFWRPMALAGVCKLLSDCLMFVPPMCLDGIVLFLIGKVEGEDNGAANITISEYAAPLTMGQYYANGYVLALVAAFGGFFHVVFIQYNYYLSARQGIRCKGAIQALVYDKTLRLSTWSLSDGGMTPGQVMNHMAVDSMHLHMLFYLFHFVWSLPLQVAMTFLLLWVQLGYSALISASLVLFLCPFQYLVGQLLAKVQKEILEKSDERLKKSNEVLQSIKLLKLYAWEMVFCRSILKTRKAELRLMLRAAFYRVLSICIVDGTPVAAALITFTIYPYMEDKPLTAGKVFSGLTLFSILGLPLYLVTMVINAISHARVSTSRMLKFLLSPEIKVQTTLPEVEAKVTSTIERNGLSKQDSVEGVANPKMLHSGTIPSITVDRAPDIDQNADDDTTRPLLHQGQPVNEPNTNQTITDTEAKGNGSDDEAAIVVEKGNFAWDLISKEPVLHDISLRIPKGKLTLVVGSVGSGKSSLLAAMLGEMTTTSGAVTNLKGVSVAYGTQKAWLINATLKENIIFGGELNEERYQEVLRCCALLPDISVLPAGDKTEIGEKGINMSGGQKQRISIARTLYADPDIVLLDDPLSALDVHVGRHIFFQAVMEYLLAKNKTVVLVTHQLQYLPHAQQIVKMKNGRIQFAASLEEIKESHPNVYKKWQENMDSAGDEAGPEKTSLDSKSDNEEGEKLMEFHGEAPIRNAISMVSFSSLQDVSDKTETCEKFEPNDTKQDSKDIDDSEVGQLIEEEERAAGSVSFKVYKGYAQAASYWLTVLTLVAYSTRQALRMVTDYWLARWTDAARMADEHNAGLGSPFNSTSGNSTDSPHSTALPPPEFDVKYWIHGYAILSTVSMVFSGVIIMCMESMCLVAARNLHKKMLNAIILAPMRFFDTTPVGRIINRMAGDTMTIDERMPFTLDSLLFSVLFVIGGLIVNAVTMPFFILPAIPMIIIFVAIQRFYIASSRELQRLDNISRSPVLAHFSETLGGLSTIRAFGDQKRFQHRNWAAIDDNNTAFLYLQAANNWMGVRLDLLGHLIVFVAAVCSITSSLYGYVTPSLTGLAIAYAIMISTFLNWTMRGMSEAEMWFSCVQRVIHYHHVPSEVWHADREIVPGANWPSKGEIRIEGVSLQYAPGLDRVIKDLSLHIKGGDKVGICGRTGSGKSSLTLGLFRLINICAGRILIDDIDISTVPLRILRARLSIIPQDPVLFAGTVRYNLDPEQQHDEPSLWKAIEIAQLKDIITAHPKQLDSPVSEGGENFSQGQRQLFCLARAFLRDSRILIMDEATASIDMETDAVIQEVIKTAFKERTVITVAHRVATILDSDSIIVLRQGELLEHDTPSNLISTDTVFASMVRENQ